MAEAFNASTWLVDRRVAAGDGARVAFLHPGGVVTYDELLGLVDSAAAGLRDRGCRREERVAFVLRDSLELAVGILAALRIGAVALPLNPLHPARDVAAVVADARARVAVVADATGDLTAALVSAAAPDLAGVVVVGPVPRGMATAGVTVTDWESLLAVGGDGSPAGTLDESPGFWLSTSGTTGRPKLAMHRHADLRSTAEGYAREVLAVTAGDVHLSAAPMFHAYGLGNSLSFPLSAGASAVLEPTRPPTPRLVADLMARHRPTLFFAVPTIYAALLASDLPPDAFASVRQGVSAGEALPADLVTRFRDRFGVEILDGIGSTEMTHIFISNRRGDVVPGASGTVVGGHRLRITDDDGAEVEAGRPGQLWVSGDAAAAGYWCRTAETRATFVGEWVRTGDVYTVDGGGVYRHLGRRDDMLRVAGEWISPAEVEEVLLTHPEVVEAVVVGAPDSDGLTRAVAFVVARDGADLPGTAVIEHCRGRVAGYKRPRHVLVLAALPKTATGKVQRAELRVQARAVLAQVATAAVHPAAAPPAGADLAP